MFKKVGQQYVIDETAGISLEATGLNSFRYADNDYIASLSSEPLMKDGKYSVCLYLSELTSWDFPENQELTDEEREIIGSNVIQALKVLDIEVEVE